MVEEKRARVPLAMNMDRIRFVYDILSKVKEFVAVEARCLPVAGFMAEDFRPRELISHE